MIRAIQLKNNNAAQVFYDEEDAVYVKIALRGHKRIRNRIVFADRSDADAFVDAIKRLRDAIADADRFYNTGS